MKKDADVMFKKICEEIKSPIKFKFNIKTVNFYFGTKIRAKPLH